ncbi:hypothetical protein JCM9140_3045 [Halalkalibacter wakoensis JCM 9140]|uniref:Small peptidoglycan-associated lipoprotein n=1 Tax=Halalkalibacter wakoensis JCM 9140 TaxID=1236970 RepID=W4Q4E7_9BACI|nr:hypothetical protein [Halalkalibacter wakoensis]GAE26936.1 hypothetical protein JCM9140_3045 [Halalkalibacter wakoensis JCM 9140]
MKYFLIFFVCLPLFIGCSNLDKAKEVRVIGQMKLDEEKQYHLYSFWSEIPQENWEEEETNNDLRRQFELYSSFHVPVGKLHLLSYPSPESDAFHDYVQVLDLNEFPTFIMLDHEGIVLRTTNVDELLEFINALPDIEH